jgi:hypothetical protein
MPEFAPLPAPTTTVESLLHGVCTRLEAVANLLEQQAKAAPKAEPKAPRASTASDGAGAKPASTSTPASGATAGKGQRRQGSAKARAR